jgi:ubiquinone/menaquinone biosynthesis C-methylase UbiE
MCAIVIGTSSGSRAMPYGERDFTTSTGKEMRRLWENVFENSFHLKQTGPTLTDLSYRRLVERFFLKWTKPKPGEWVLKLDMYNESTWTKYAYYFIEKRLDVAFVDVSHTVIEVARRRMMKDRLYDRVHPILADFRCLPFKPESFGIACSFGSIEHVREWRTCLDEQRNVTKLGGCIIVGVPNVQNLWMRYWSCRLLNKIGVLRKLTSPELHFTSQEIREAMLAADLSNVEVDGYHLFPKQLRWLDLWIQQFPDRSIAKARDLLLSPIVAVFERIEWQETALNLFAEMLIAKGIKCSQPSES